MQDSISEVTRVTQHVFVKISKNPQIPNVIEGERRIVSGILSSLSIDLTKSSAPVVADAFGQFGFAVTSVSELPSENSLIYVLQRKVDGGRARARSQSK